MWLKWITREQSWDMCEMAFCLNTFILQMCCSSSFLLDNQPADWNQTGGKRSSRGIPQGGPLPSFTVRNSPYQPPKLGFLAASSIKSAGPWEKLGLVTKSELASKSPDRDNSGAWAKVVEVRKVMSPFAIGGTSYVFSWIVSLLIALGIKWDCSITSYKL